ncbi:lysR family transcriptional regulator [Bordetella ansorpii]|uniref:LysR family transcriptional regulator n=1 Tax=Bordetella ansorpii TaxID=288768 RepID=A0A157QPW3_9BORD|nr:lysR family transcriptional regulator [Bordetella ansorpii]
MRRLEEPHAPSPPPAPKKKTITLAQLRTFAAIADAGSFQVAAKVLFRSQPAISQQLKQLERVLGASLLSRSQGHVAQVTAAGERFLAVVKEALDQLDGAIHAFQRAAGAPQVRLGVPADILPIVLRALGKSSTLGPDLEVTLVTGLSAQLLRGFKHQAFDVILYRSLQSVSQGLEECLLEAETLHWIADRELCIDQLPAVPLVTFPEENLYRVAAIGSLDGTSRPWSIRCTTAEIDNVRAAVRAGLGIGTLPGHLLDQNVVVLNERHGFPPLPPVRLSMAVHGQSHPLAGHVAELLAAQWSVTAE